MRTKRFVDTLIKSSVAIVSVFDAKRKSVAAETSNWTALTDIEVALRRAESDSILNWCAVEMVVMFASKVNTPAANTSASLAEIDTVCDVKAYPRAWSVVSPAELIEIESATAMLRLSRETLKLVLSPTEKSGVLKPTLDPARTNIALLALRE